MHSRIPVDETESDFLEATPQAPVSAGLEEGGLSSLHRMRFAKGEGRLQRHSGYRLISDQTLWNGALEKALVIDARLAPEVAACRKLPSAPIQTEVAVYSNDAEEGVGLPDGIGVTSQQPTPEKPGEPPLPKAAKRQATDVRLLEQPDGEFVLRRGRPEAPIALVWVVACLRRTWGNRDTRLPVGALTEGARSIRRDRRAVLGPEVRIMLDGSPLAYSDEFEHRFGS